MSASQDEPAPSIKGAESRLNDSLTLISDAAHVIQDAENSAIPEDETKKNQWDKAHKAASLAIQLEQRGIQGRGVWLQSLALCLAGLGSLLAGYSAIITTSQSSTAISALEQATKSAQAATMSAQTAAQSLTLARSTYDLTSHPILSLSLATELPIQQDVSLIPIYLKNIGNHPAYIHAARLSATLSDTDYDLKRHIPADFLKSPDISVVVEPQHGAVLQPKGELTIVPATTNGQELFVTGEVILSGLDGTRYIRSVCMVYFRKDYKFQSDGNYCKYNNLDERITDTMTR